MTVEGLIGTVVSQLDMNYFYGSYVTVNQRVSKIKDADNKYPAVILFNEFKEKVISDPFSLFQMEAEIDLFFVDKVNPAWSEAKHTTDAVIPMRTKAESLITAIDNSRCFGDVVDADIRNITNWNLILQAQTKSVNVFPDVLSGVKLSFTLLVKRIADCFPCIIPDYLPPPEGVTGDYAFVISENDYVMTSKDEYVIVNN